MRKNIVFTAAYVGLNCYLVSFWRIQDSVYCSNKAKCVV